MDQDLSNMAQKGEAASQFINALIKSLQTLCHGYLEFQNGIEIIGHINLSVDKGGSLDYILKEKVCKNAENSTLFISNSFHAEANPEDIAQRRQAQSEGTQCGGPNSSVHHSERGKVASAISSITSSLSGPRGKHRRCSEARESHQKSSKRRLSVDQSNEFHPAKMSHMSESVDSRQASSPTRSRSSHQGLSTSDSGASETLLPQTAGVGDSSGIEVNLAGSVLEPVENQNDSDLARRDDDIDSDGDLEVTFIKEEYGQEDSSAGDFDSSGGLQFVGAAVQRDGSRFPGSLHDGSAAFPSFDHNQPFTGDAGTSTSQPGPSGMRGVSGIQSFVNSLSAFGSLGAPGLPLGQVGASAGASRQSKGGGLPKAAGSNQLPGSGAYAKSQTSLQRAFALHREDKRKKQEGSFTSEEDLKQRLELMSELLSLKGMSSTEDYKTALIREKRRLAKKIYRASLPEEKKIEIKEKDKLHKRMKRATRWAAAASMVDASQHFSDCSSDMNTQKDFDDIPRTGSGFSGSFAGVGSVPVDSLHDKDQGGAGGAASRQSCDSPRMPARSGSVPGSEENLHHGLPSEALPCEAGMSSESGGGVPRLGPSCLGNIPRICSTSSAHIGVGPDPTESFASARPGGVGSASMVFGSVGSVPWMDPVAFDTSAQGHRPLDHDGGQREGYNLMKLGQR